MSVPLEKSKTLLVMQIQDAMDAFTDRTGYCVKRVKVDHYETTLPGEWKRQWMHLIDADVGKIRKPRGNV